MIRLKHFEFDKNPNKHCLRRNVKIESKFKRRLSLLVAHVKNHVSIGTGLCCPLNPRSDAYKRMFSATLSGFDPKLINTQAIFHALLSYHGDPLVFSFVIFVCYVQ